MSGTALGLIWNKFTIELLTLNHINIYLSEIPLDATAGKKIKTRSGNTNQ